MSELPNPDQPTTALRAIFCAPVIVAALGYFVDIYDLVLFSVVRIPSLKDLGLTGDPLTSSGLFLLNMQMIGMLVGGILWGVIGDRRGRMTTLFGSITLYSIANFLNGFVDSVPQYAALRLIAGIGLAGELGAGITLVVESLPKGIRGYGTMVVASVGVAGAILAYAIATKFGWRTSYMIGGGMGLALLALRVFAHESGMFAKLAAAGGHTTGVARGAFLSLFTDRSRLRRFITCVGIGVPLWYVVGILITLSPELAAAQGVILPIVDGKPVPIDGGKAIMLCYTGLVIGDLASCLVSQWLRSRKRTLWCFLGLTVAGCAAYFLLTGLSAFAFYGLCLFLGIAVGYWAIFVTVAAEQFGTNLRATVATSVPNFVRGSLVPISALFGAFKSALGIVPAAAVVGGVVLTIAATALWFLEETFDKDLEFTE